MGRLHSDPSSIRGFDKSATSQINSPDLIYGGRHREARIPALRSLLGIREADPELFTV